MDSILLFGVFDNYFLSLYFILFTDRIDSNNVDTVSLFLSSVTYLYRLL